MIYSWLVGQKTKDQSRLDFCFNWQAGNKIDLRIIGQKSNPDSNEQHKQ